MTGSDGSGGHPRKFGTFPRKLREYVYTKRLIDEPFFVRHSSALTAETFGLKDRGLLREGYFADIVGWDPATVRDQATFEEPERLAVGMRFVLVNGRAAVRDGAPTGVLAGKPLRGARAAPSPVTP